MKLLLDQNIPHGAVEYLRESGFEEVMHASDLVMQRSPDRELLELARAAGAVVVTKDGDFHALLALGGLNSPSVIRLRAEHLRGRDMAMLIEQVALTCANQLAAGAVVTCDAAGRLHIRNLPLRPR